MSKAGWYVHFREPILTPKGALLITLRDAGDYITRLPKAEHDSKPWQTAMHCLLQAADSGGPTDFARMGVMQALYPKGDPVYSPRTKEPKWRRAKLVRDQ
ncbi:hypothetical protein V1282_003965 [Nitrobacteraceae bacterium AZCC 2146]